MRFPGAPFWERDRTIIFAVGCAVVRASLAAAALAVRDAPLRAVLATGLGAIGAGFVYQSFYGSDTGSFGGPAFWASARPVHAAAYLGAAALVAADQGFVAAGVLAADLAFGSALLGRDRLR